MFAVRRLCSLSLNSKPVQTALAPTLFRVSIYHRKPIPASKGEPRTVSGASIPIVLPNLGPKYFYDGVLDTAFWEIDDEDTLLLVEKGTRFKWNHPLINETKMNTDASCKNLEITIGKKFYPWVMFETAVFRSKRNHDVGPVLDLVLLRYTLYEQFLKPSVLLHEISAMEMAINHCCDNKSANFLYEKIMLTTDSYHAVLAVNARLYDLSPKDKARLKEYLSLESEKDRGEITAIASRIARKLELEYGVDAEKIARSYLNFVYREANFAADCCANFIKDKDMEGEIQLTEEGNGQIFAITKVSNNLRTILNKDKFSSYIHFPRNFSTLVDARKGKLSVPHLPDSKRIDKSGSEGYTTSVAKSTYLSQSASGKCINALDVPIPVPVCDSKLTRLHRDAFGDTRLSRNLGIQLRGLIAQHGSQHKVLHHELERKAVEAPDRVSESKRIHSETLEALEVAPTDATLLSNRSACYARMQKRSEASRPVTECTSLRLDWPKAYYRAGVALNILKRYGEAAGAFFKGLTLRKQQVP